MSVGKWRDLLWPTLRRVKFWLWLPKENTGFFDTMQEIGKGECILRLWAYFTDCGIFFLFNLCWTWAQTKPPSLQHFPGALIPLSNVHEAGSCRGSSLCSWRFAWLPPFTVSSATKKNWCYLLKWKLHVLFVTEDFLCAFPQPVQWRQRQRRTGCASSESFESSPCTGAEEIPSHPCLWSQIKVNLSGRKCDGKRYHISLRFLFLTQKWFTVGVRVCLRHSNHGVWLLGAALFISCTSLSQGQQDFMRPAEKLPTALVIIAVFHSCCWILLVCLESF